MPAVVTACRNKQPLTGALSARFLAFYTSHVPLESALAAFEVDAPQTVQDEKIVGLRAFLENDRMKEALATKN